MTTMNTKKKYKILLKAKYRIPFIKPRTIARTNNIIKASLYTDIENLRGVILVPILMVGSPGSGKSRLIDRIITTINKLYKNVDRNLCFTNSLAYNIDHMTDAPIQVLTTDDAIEYQDATSFMSSESKKTSARYFRIRHIYEEEFPDVKGAVIFTIFATQMYKALDKRLRQARMTFYKNVLEDQEEKLYLQKQIGYDAVNWLELVTDWLTSMEPSFAQFFIMKKGTEAHWGAFNAPRTHYKCQYINPATSVKDEKLLEFAKIAAMRTRPKEYSWEKIQKILKNDENPVTFRTRFSTDLKKFIKKFNLELKEQ
ncbi:MAG: hypothetical protein ACTSUK_07185 [Promethearchaeota archaeon]